MLKVFDAALTSNDMSLDRVLNAGLPVAMVFHDGNLPADLRQSMDELARQYAVKVLVVMFARNDSAQAISRFGIRRFPTLVTARDGKTVTSLDECETGRSELIYCLSFRRRAAASHTCGDPIQCGYKAGNYQRTHIRQ